MPTFLTIRPQLHIHFYCANTNYRFEMIASCCWWFSYYLQYGDKWGEMQNYQAIWVLTLCSMDVREHMRTCQFPLCHRPRNEMGKFIEFYLLLHESFASHIVFQNMCLICIPFFSSEIDVPPWKYTSQLCELSGGATQCNDGTLAQISLHIYRGHHIAAQPRIHAVNWELSWGGWCWRNFVCCKKKKNWFCWNK